MIRLSPTNLDRWFTLGCPAAWDFSYRFSPVVPNPYAKFGSDVHAFMETGESEDPTVIKTGQKLWDLAHLLGLRDVKKPLIEFKQEWKLAPGITFVRKLDRIMEEPNGTQVIVDWKTHAGYGWKPVKETNITPQTLGPQTSGYFLDAPTTVLQESGLKRWPKVMYYLVGPARGLAQAYRVERDKHADQNFQDLLAVAVAAIKQKSYPKNYGKHCHDCEVRALCFETDGYEDQFTKYR